MDTRFGSSSLGLLHRLRRAPVTIPDLREAADAVLPALGTRSLRVRVVDRAGGGAVLLLEEHERHLRVRLAELAEAMTRAGVPPTSDGIRAALASWVAHRPVTDEAAARSGVAVLDWTDASESALGWQVVVARGEAVLPWTPSPLASGAAVESVRAGAAARSTALPLELRVEGPVALWSHPTAPLLATAALLDPARMLGRIAEAGLELADLHVVVTPSRPVACAEPGVAARLARDTTEPCLTLPRPRLAALSWN